MLWYFGFRLNHFIFEGGVFLRFVPKRSDSFAEVLNCDGSYFSKSIPTGSSITSGWGCSRALGACFLKRERGRFPNPWAWVEVQIWVHTLRRLDSWSSNTNPDWYLCVGCRAWSDRFLIGEKATVPNYILSYMMNSYYVAFGRIESRKREPETRTIR